MTRKLSPKILVAVGLLVAWMLEEAERQPLLSVWEDLHWADPSTLELLGLFIDQAATVPMMNVLTYRPEFAPPWPMGSHLTLITLNRLERAHIEALVSRLAGGKRLPTVLYQGCDTSFVVTTYLDSRDGHYLELAERSNGTDSVKMRFREYMWRDGSPDDLRFADH